MTPVVVDATAFILFARIVRFPLLREALRPFSVVTSPGVYDEVAGPKAQGRPGAVELAQACSEWMTVQAPSTAMLTDVSAELSDVDREVLTLTQEIGACLLSDDARLCREVERRGAVVFSSLGLIEGMIQVGLLVRDDALTMGQALVDVGLRIDRTLFDDWRRRVAAMS